MQVIYPELGGGYQGRLWYGVAGEGRGGFWGWGIEGSTGVEIVVADDISRGSR